eukprot:Lankesteria_metandrocarpae@DN2906_c0_g1_i3.p1
MKTTVGDEDSVWFATAQGLMDNRRYKDVIHMCNQAAENQNIPPHKKILWTTLKIYSLIRFKMYRQAGDEVTALGPLDHNKYHFDCHKELYPRAKGSMIPFALRVLSSCVPIFMGFPSLGVDRMYALHTWTHKQLIHHASTTALLNVWTSRLVVTAHILAVCLCQETHYVEALTLLQGVLGRQPQHIPTLKLMGRICVEMGTPESAEDYFTMADCITKSTSHVNRGLLLMAKSEFGGARANFERGTKSSGNDYESEAVVYNNLAVAALYTSDLQHARTCLEEMTLRPPNTASSAATSRSRLTKVRTAQDAAAVLCSCTAMLYCHAVLCSCTVQLYCHAVLPCCTVQLYCAAV